MQSNRLNKIIVQISCLYATLDLSLVMFVVQQQKFTLFTLDA